MMLLLAVSAVAVSISLHDLVEKNDAKGISQVLNGSQHPQQLLSIQDENEVMPIHLAAWHGHAEAVTALVDGGAPLEARCEYGNMTALHWATGQDHVDVMELLLNAGAETEARDGGGRTALHFAAARGHVGGIRALIEANASLDTLSARNVTALQMAAEHGFADAARTLAGGGANLEAQEDETKLAALHAASAMGHVDTVRVLLQAGAALEARDARQRTPLHLASAMAKSSAVRSCTPRMAAALGEHTSLAKMFASVPQLSP